MKKNSGWRGRIILVAALAMIGCGGSSEEESYPVMFEYYSGEGALGMADFGQEFAAADGYTWQNNCLGMIRVLSQDGGAWTRRVERGVNIGRVRERCYSSGEIAGELGTDGSLHFTLTQERWPSADVVATPTTQDHRIDCTAVGPGRYTGHIAQNRFHAVGTIQVLCDDGREATVTETVQASHPAPEGSHDVG
jgi:hypothetical protein